MNGFPVIILVGIPFFFAGVWLLMMRILSFASGWTQLAERFQHAGEFRGEVHHSQSARMRGVNFNGVLEIGVGGEGLFLVPMRLFRPFHKPLLIPWEEMHAEPFRRFLSRGYTISFHSFPGLPFEVSGGTFEKLQGHLGA
jgi:hypothetical protein